MLKWVIPRQTKTTSRVWCAIQTLGIDVIFNQYVDKLSTFTPKAQKSFCGKSTALQYPHK
jgi:hypothetical protein